MPIDLSTIPTLRPTRFQWRFDRDRRRLSVTGSECDRDMPAIRRLIGRGVIPGDLNAITHVAASGLVSIFRARRLAEWIGGC